MDAAYMTYRELRIAENKKKRLKIVRRQRILLAFVIIIVVFLSVFLAMTLESNAGSDDVMYKYYTSRTIQRDDTLYDMAQNYSDGYGDMDEYINEVCIINHIDDKDSLQVGESIIVPYYSYEFK